MRELTVNRRVVNVLKQQLLKAGQENIQRYVVGAVIAKNNKVLCLKRAGNDFMPGIYELPSGKVEKDEELIVALKREVYEETGMEIESVDDYLGYFDYQSRSGAQTRQFNFSVKCFANQPVVIAEKEHEGFVWLPETEMAQYRVTDEVKKVVRAYFLQQAAGIHNAELLDVAQQAGVARFVAGGAIERNGNILLLKRASNDFMGGIDELPSGRQEGGEALVITAIREIKEETGLDVQKITGVLNSFDYTSGSGVQTRQFNFALQVDSQQQVTLSEEHEGLCWIKPQQLSNTHVSKEVRELLENYYLPKPTLMQAEALTSHGQFKRKREEEETPKAPAAKRQHTETSTVEKTAVPVASINNGI